MTHRGFNKELAVRLGLSVSVVVILLWTTFAQAPSARGGSGLGVMKISSDMCNYTIGETVRINFSNVGNDSIWWPERGTIWKVPFEILDEDGKDAFVTLQPSMTIFTTLEPGESYNTTWNQTYNAPGTPVGQQVPPGRYKIHAEGRTSDPSLNLTAEDSLWICIGRPCFELTAVFDRPMIPRGTAVNLTVYFNNSDGPARNVELARSFSASVEMLEEKSSPAGGWEDENGTWHYPTVEDESNCLWMRLKVSSGPDRPSSMNAAFVLEFSDDSSLHRQSISTNVSIELLPAGHEGREPSTPPDLTVSLLSIFALGSLAVALAVERLRLLVLGLPIFLWTKLRHDELLDNEKRGMIRGYLAANPGANFASIRNDLDLATGTLVHHLRIMEKEGLVKSWSDSRYKRFALTEHPVAAAEPRLTDIELIILQAIRNDPEMTQAEIAEVAGIGQPTISYHVSKLKRLGLVAVSRNGLRRRYATAIGDEEEAAEQQAVGG